MAPSIIFERIFGDFERFYGRRRIVLNVAFWMSLLSIYILDLLLVNSAFNLNIAFVLALRQVLQSSFAFYFICYLVIPKLLLKGHYFSGISSLLIPFLLAPLINYLTFITFFKLLLSDKTSLEYVNLGLFAKNPQSIISFNQIVLSFMPLVLRTMPAFVMKLLVATVRYFHNSRQQQQREHELEMTNFQLEINFLKSQMNPHFFFNTLNNIYSSVYLKDERALDLISDLSEIMKYTLYTTRNQSVPLEQELQFLEHYIKLEKTRYGERDGAIESDFNFNNMKGMTIAPLLLFPFVENAFKYGIAGNKKTGWLKATARLYEDSLYFEIENSKPKTSFHPGSREKVFIKDQPAIGGIGVSSTVRRLSLLYKDKHELIIKNDDDDTFAVTLKLKCRKNEPKVAMSYY